MNTLPFRLSVAFLLSCAVFHAEDWQVLGKTYRDVKINKIGPDDIEISYDGGVGRLTLADLPPYLQKRFNYDAAKTKQSLQPGTNAARAAPAMAEVNNAVDQLKVGVKEWLAPKSPPQVVQPVTSTALDQKNGFRNYLLGVPLASFDPNSLDQGPYLNAVLTTS